MARKPLRKFEDWNINLIGIVALVCLFIGILLGYVINPNPVKEQKVICYDIADFNETINEITENCGQAFIVKQFGSDEWSVFHSINSKDGYSRYVYNLVEECIIGEK